jgi:hypothetical protein
MEHQAIGYMVKAWPNGVTYDGLLPLLLEAPRLHGPQST